jgi:hypothetical protein
MRRRFSGRNEVAGEFLGDLGESIDFWRDQGRRASRGKITYATGKFYAGREDGSIQYLLSIQHWKRGISSPMDRFESEDDR